jgi:uncharacterized metal-binding protein
MPNGKTHDQFTLATGVLSTPVVFYYSQKCGYNPGIMTVCFFVGHLFGGMMLSPDLDGNTNALQRWGILGIIWLPYRCLVPHRHWFSHMVVISSVIRIAYMVLVFYFCLFAFSFIDHESSNLVMEYAVKSFNYLYIYYNQEMFLFFIGCITGGDTHVILDWLSPPDRSNRRDWRRD